MPTRTEGKLYQFINKDRFRACLIGTASVFIVIALCNICYSCGHTVSNSETGVGTSLNSESWQCFENNIEVLKVLILALGGLGGIYGLGVANRRADNSQNQLNNAQEQLFNERLGRGVELLSQNEMTTHIAGIRVLNDLAMSSTPSQVNLIIHLIHDLVKRRAQPIYEENSANLLGAKDRTLRQDIEFAIISIFDLLEYAEINSDDVPFSGLDFRGLDFSNATLKGAVFSGSEMEFVDFKFAKLHKAKFIGSNLQVAAFYDAELNGADFRFAELQEAFLINAKLKGANFDGAIFSDVDLDGSKFLTQKQLSLIMYDPKNAPKNLPIGLSSPEDRKCVVKNGILTHFVPSDEDWSGMAVQEWKKQHMARN